MSRIYFNAVADPTLDPAYEHTTSLPYATAAPTAFAGDGETELRAFNGQSSSGWARVFAFNSAGGILTGATVTFQQKLIHDDDDSWVDVIQLDSALELGVSGVTTAGVIPNGIYKVLVAGSPGSLIIGMEGI